MQSNKHLRRTKIVATLGPASDDPAVLEAMLLAGANVVRLNFSHGSHADHQQRAAMVRKISSKHNLIIGILADLQGPKIRVANFVEKKVQLIAGDSFILDANCAENQGTTERVGIDYKQLPEDVSTDDTLLLDDGRLKLKVRKVVSAEIHCEVLNTAYLSNHKGINRQGGGLNAKALTAKDKEDLKCAVAMSADYIAISFPRDAADLHEARELIEQAKGDAGIIAKIERAEAVLCIDDIIAASDGVMVARGDLAVEIGDAEVPLVQKTIISRARALDKPVIVATQMMESMIEEPVPTRAEVSDVANAVLDNVDAVMLSAETAAGKYPVESIQMMSDVCSRVGKQPSSQVSKHRVECNFSRVDEAVAMATMYAANHLDVSAVIALTESGATTLWMSRIRTGLPIFGLSRAARSLGKMTLYRGVYPIYFDLMRCTRDELNKKAVKEVQSSGYINNGDKVILTKGDHLGVGGGSNAMKILIVGEVV
jgi:pyruvate kinase